MEVGIIRRFKCSNILYKLFIDKSNDNFISNFQNSQNKNFQINQNNENKNFQNKN